MQRLRWFGGCVVLVAALAVGLALPMAWLVARTDLPGRRVWAVLGALPTCNIGRKLPGRY